MTTFADLTNDVLLLMEGYGLNQDRAAFITGTDLDDTALSFTVGDAANIGPGVAEIEDELIYVQSVDSGTNTITVSPDGRGYRGTTAAAHVIGKRVTMNPLLPRTLVKRKINETIVGTYPTLFGVASTTLTYDPVQIAYSLPAEAEEILEITYRSVGPTNEWPAVKRWRLDQNPDPTVFPAGKVLNIFEGLGPITDIRVVYRKQPSELSFDSDDLTDSGLQSSARAVVTAGAAWRLVSFMDSARLNVSTPMLDQMDERNPVGTATQVGSYLRKQYERELADEQTRQQLAVPPILHWTE